jgi:peptide/nickel transport system permease protein
MSRPVNILFALFRRASQVLLLSLLITFATFQLSSMIPGDFFTLHQSDPTIQAETIALLRQQHGLDQPFYLQYARWMRGFFHLDLGYSLYLRTPVSRVISDAAVNTLWIGLPALLVGVGAGIFLGTLHGIHRNRPLGAILDITGTVALSLPSLVLGLGAIFFAVRTHWFPLGSLSSPSLQSPGFWAWLLDRMHHIFLPALCLAVPILATVERIQAAATADLLEAPYIRSARARGLTSTRIFIQYVQRPALNPILSTSGPIIGSVLSGSLVLEVIFAWPGLGQMTYDALFSRDVYLLVGCVVSTGALLLSGNVAADLALFALDPRTRNSSGGGPRL